MSGRLDAGRLEFAEIRSLKGGLCQLLLPDEGNQLRASSGGKEKSMTRNGRLLTFATAPGETIVLSLPGVSHRILALRPVDSEKNFFGNKKVKPAVWLPNR